MLLGSDQEEYELYTYKVERFLILGKLEYDDSDSNSTRGVEEGCYNNNAFDGEKRDEEGQEEVCEDHCGNNNNNNNKSPPPLLGSSIGPPP